MKWIALFFFSAPAFATPMSFDTALQTILDHDTEIQRVDAVRTAVEGRGIAKRFHFVPKLAVEGSETKYDPSGSLTTSILGTAQVSVFRFGADLAALDSAKAEERAARARVDQARLDREKYAVDRLVNFIRISLENDVLKRLETMQIDSLGIAKNQMERGRIPVQEMQKVQIDLENVRSRIGEATINLEAARTDLIRLLGNADVATEWPWKEKIATAEAPAALNPTAHLNDRPDFVAASEALQAQDRLQAQAYRLMFPELGAKLSYGYLRDSLGSNQFNRTWIGAVTLTIPIFNQFTDYSNYKFQSGNRMAAEASRDGVVRQIEAELVSVPDRFRASQKTALARTQILQLSKKLYQDNLTRFRLGRATSNELNIDLNRFLETELNEIAGWAVAHLAYTDLAHLYGKTVLQP